MKRLRQTIRNIILENAQQKHFENLLPMLDSHDVESVKPAIEMCTGMGYAKLLQHKVMRGQNRGGRIEALHVFTLQLKQPMMEFFRRVFDDNMGSSPNSHIFDAAADMNMKNFGKKEIEIFAEDGLKTWVDYCDEWNDRSVTEVELPV